MEFGDLAGLIVAMLGIGFIIRSVGVAVARVRGAGRQPVAIAAPPAEPVAPPQLAAIHAEMDELRAEVERLRAAERFYAQLQAPAPHPGDSAASA